MKKTNDDDKLRRKKYTQEDLDEIIKKHEKWLKNEDGGEFADLSYCDLSGIKLPDLKSCKIYEDGIYEHGVFQSANLSKTDLHNSGLSNADLSYTDLSGAILKGTNLTGANLSGANVAFVQYNRKTNSRGIRAETCYGSQMFKSYIQHQDFLEELKGRSWWGKPLWLLG